LVEANISEKHTVSIFRAEVLTSALKMETAGKLFLDPGRMPR
jgi:hypothetical protein